MTRGYKQKITPDPYYGRRGHHSSKFENFVIPHFKSLLGFPIHLDIHYAYIPFTFIPLMRGFGSGYFDRICRSRICKRSDPDPSKENRRIRSEYPELKPPSRIDLCLKNVLSYMSEFLSFKKVLFS